MNPGRIYSNYDGLYEGPFDPSDYDDFRSPEDADWLQDLDLEGCDICGGDVIPIGTLGLGKLVIVDCTNCKARLFFEVDDPESGEEGALEDDGEEESAQSRLLAESELPPVFPAPPDSEWG